MGGLAPSYPNGPKLVITIHISGVGNAAAAAALAAAPFRPKWCGKASSEPYISAEVGKG